MRLRRRSAKWWGPGLLVGAALAGCSGEPRTPTYPVVGAVQVKGEAASGAFVVFHPRTPPPPGPDGTETPRPTGKVGEDGSFTLSTFEEGDGAPAGEYAVTVDWYKLVGKGSEVQRGPNVVPAKYTNAETTPLKVTVRPEPNKIEPLQITK